MTKRTLKKYMDNAHRLFVNSGWEVAYNYLIDLYLKNRLTQGEFHYIVNALGI